MVHTHATRVMCYGSRFVCVYLLPCHTSLEIRAACGSLWRFQDLHCVTFIESALLK